MTPHSTQTTRPIVGIGACLTGQAVRYNGETKPPIHAVQALMDTFEMRPFCPEIGVGMGVPRPPIHLVGEHGDAVRALDVATHDRDYTEALAAYASGVLQRAPELCGYILVKGSPSCGYRQVKRFDDRGELVARDTRGIFAAALRAGEPLLPLEDDEQLEDPARRESFASRVYCYHAWKLLLADDLTPQALEGFYWEQAKPAMTGQVSACRRIENLLAGASNHDLRAIADELIRTVMAALSASPRSTTPEH